MPNVFLEGLQRPAILQNNSGLPDYSEANDGDALIIEDGEPTWGAVDALPEIEETDEGKVLAVDQGEAVWADAPSGLPEITNSDEGKVLTVVGEAERTEIIPEQSLTTTGAMIAEATIPNHADNPPESMTVEIDGVAYTNVQFDSSSESYTISNGSTTVGQIAVDGDDWVFIKTPAGTYTLSAYIESPKEYSAEWAEPSGGGGTYVVTFDTPVTVEELTFIVSDKTDTEVQQHFNNGDIIFAYVATPDGRRATAVIEEKYQQDGAYVWGGLFVAGGNADLIVISAEVAQQMPALAEYVGFLAYNAV